MFVPTTARVLMNEWKGFRSVIAEMSYTAKAQQQALNADPAYLLHFLTDVQLQDAFTHPFSPILQTFVMVYSRMTRLRTRLVLLHDDSFKEQTQVNDMGLTDEVMAYKDINAAALDKLQKQVDTMARSSYQQWVDWVSVSFTERLLKALIHSEIALSAAEVETFQKIETTSELQDRFVDLQLTLPKTKSKNDLSYYYRLKIALAIHSALHRQHLTNSEEKVQKILKEYKAEFKNIAQEENEWLAKQQQAINTLAVSLGTFA